MIERLVYRIDRAGNLKKLEQRKETLPSPGRGEVQVKVHAIGLNFADIFAVMGLYSATPKGSFVPGLEYSGVIEEVGEDVSSFKKGDRIMGVTRFGAYATHLNIDAAYVAPIPSEWLFAEAAGYLVQALTAYYGLFRLGNLQPGMNVLIHSAAGGVGIQANRMAQHTGAYTIGTVGSEKKIELLKEEKYQEWIVRDRNFRKTLSEKLNGRKLDLVMECIGGDVLKAGFENLAPMGRMVVYGSARYGDSSNRPNWLRLVYLYLTRPKIDPQKLPENNKGILGFNLIWLYERKELMKEILRELDSMHLPPPVVGHEFGFDDMYKALKLFQSGRTTGKVVVLTGAG
jgi:NADPH:quinone reductase-like Zn-dependent oxidoreductase